MNAPTPRGATALQQQFGLPELLELEFVQTGACTSRDDFSSFIRTSKSPRLYSTTVWSLKYCVAGAELEVGLRTEVRIWAADAASPLAGMRVAASPSAVTMGALAADRSAKHQ